MRTRWLILAGLIVLFFAGVGVMEAPAVLFTTIWFVTGSGDEPPASSFLDIHVHNNATDPLWVTAIFVNDRDSTASRWVERQRLREGWRWFDEEHIEAKQEATIRLPLEMDPRSLSIIQVIARTEDGTLTVGGQKLAVYLLSWPFKDGVPGFVQRDEGGRHMPLDVTIEANDLVWLNGISFQTGKSSLHECTERVFSDAVKRFNASKADLHAGNS